MKMRCKDISAVTIFRNVIFYSFFFLFSFFFFCFVLVHRISSFFFFTTCLLFSLSIIFSLMFIIISESTPLFYYFHCWHVNKARKKAPITFYFLIFAIFINLDSSLFAFFISFVRLTVHCCGFFFPPCLRPRVSHCIVFFQCVCEGGGPSSSLSVFSFQFSENITGNHEN